jgi:hypothetical protein
VTDFSEREWEESVQELKVLKLKVFKLLKRQGTAEKAVIQANCFA